MNNKIGLGLLANILLIAGLSINAKPISAGSNGQQLRNGSISSYNVRCTSETNTLMQSQNWNWFTPFR